MVGGGPAGRAVAAACGERGLRTRLLDPSPGRPWPATYGCWRDELPAWLPPDVLAATAPATAFARREHRLDRDYAVFDAAALRGELDQRLAAHGVRVERGRARVTVERARARPSDLPPAGVVIDAGGHGQPLAAGSARRGGYTEQTAFGLVLPAELAEPLRPSGTAVFMDWRPPEPLVSERDRYSVTPHSRAPATFLYAVPLGGDRVLVEETSLAARPGLGLDVLEARLRARLAGHGIRPPDDAPRELVRFPLDRPRHRAPGVLGFGAAAPLTHPATGYQLADALRLAPAVAQALAAGLSDSPAKALTSANALLWGPSARLARQLRRYGLELMLRLPPADLPAFFEAFFSLPARDRWTFLDGRDRPAGCAMAMARVFGKVDRATKLRLIGSSLLVSPPPGVHEWSSVG